MTTSAPETFTVAIAAPPSVSPLIGTAWDVVAGQAESHSDLRDLLLMLEENPHTRSCALLRAVERARVELSRTPADAGLEDPIELTVRDTALLVRAVLSRLR
jgi:hypothetical protein